MMNANDLIGKTLYARKDVAIYKSRYGKSYGIRYTAKKGKPIGVVASWFLFSNQLVFIVKDNPNSDLWGCVYFEQGSFSLTKEEIKEIEKAQDERGLGEKIGDDFSAVASTLKNAIQTLTWFGVGYFIQKALIK